MQVFFVSSTPLAADQKVYSRWVDISGTGDLPHLIVNALSDQAGSFQVLESMNPTDPSTVTVLGGGTTKANTPFSAGFGPRKHFVQVVYTNGPTAQTSLALTAQLYAVAGSISEQRTLALILRELRIQNMLLMQMREPYGSSVNIEPSLDSLET